MKTPEERNALSNEVETPDKKSADLTEEELAELAQVAGSNEEIFICHICGKQCPSLDALARHGRLHIIAYP